MLNIADLHIHSKYSRATSSSMTLKNLAYFSEIKGLNIIGSGDSTHPKWFEELSKELICDDSSGLYNLKEKRQNTKFIITTEVATVFKDSDKTRKIHHLILFPSLDVAAQLSDHLSKIANLAVDGRPILNISPMELVELIVQTSNMIEVIPAHIWTPWWGAFGSFSGYDSIEGCYQDKIGSIHAVETGLSSDPPMNWRLSQLDRFTLISNSDCHSPQPHRLGREANIFQLGEFSYSEIINIIRNKDKNLITIETKPEYGKYHWTGHRKCGVSMSSLEALKLNNHCPKCGRKMTVGVEQRIEELADRPYNFKPSNAPSFVYLLPLSELISKALHCSLTSKKVQWYYDLLISAFKNEFTILLDTSIDKIATVANMEIANLVRILRENSLKIIPGYDGLYGKIIY